MENNNQLAATGLRRVFTSQILMILAVVIAVVLQVIAVMKGAGLGVTLLLGLAVLVCMVVAFILNIMGLYKASPAHNLLKAAFYMTIGNLIFSVIGQIPGFEGVKLPAGMAQIVMDAAMVILVCRGAGDLLKAAGDEGTASLGNITIILYLICTAIYAVCQYMQLTATSPVTISLLVGMLVCQAVGKILYLIFLGKSSGSLAES